MRSKWKLLHTPTLEGVFAATALSQSAVSSTRRVVLYWAGMDAIKGSMLLSVSLFTQLFYSVCGCLQKILLQGKGRF